MALKTVTLKKTEPGQKKITFHKGGLHQSLHVAQGQKIPANLMQAAIAGREGPKAKQQANFAKNVLKVRK